MKVTCLLTSYNRPNWIRQALTSIANQTHKNYELIVLDESTAFNVESTIKEFEFPLVSIHHFDVTPEQRRSENRVGIILNIGMSLAIGDLVCFLCDDDYFYPTWFEIATSYFNRFPDRAVGFGRLRYSCSPEMVYPSTGPIRFFDSPITEPFAQLDHNQVIHRRFTQPYRWPETLDFLTHVDGSYFSAIARDHVFYPIDAMAAVKREHSKGIRSDTEALLAGTADELRE